jgi:hypothetical protein
MQEDGLKEELRRLVSDNKVRVDDVFAALRNSEILHELYLRKHFGRFCDQFELYHSTLMMLLHHLNYAERNWQGHKGLQFMIAVHSQKDLYSAYRLLQHGFYDDSAIIFRSVYESFLRIIFVSLNPAYPYNVLMRKPKEGPHFNATNLIDEQLKLDWKHFSILSNFTHSNSYRIYKAMDDNAKEDPEPITIKYEIDEDMIGLCTNYFYFLTLTNMWLVTNYLEVTPEYLNKNPEFRKLHTTGVECMNLMHEVLVTHTENEYWRVVAADLRKIFTLLEKIDKDSSLEWKKIWTDLTKTEGTSKL